MSQGINVRWGGESRHFEQPQTVVIGRDPGCDLVLDHPRISGRHATVSHDGAGWVFTDVGSTNGSWRGGSRLTAPVPVTEPMSVALGNLDDNIELALSPAVASRAPGSEAGSARPVPGGVLPPTAATPHDGLVIEAEGRTHQFGTDTRVVIGRAGDSTVTVSHPAVSGTHAVVEHDRTGWVFRDNGSTNGSWIGADRTAGPVRVQGRLVVRLGKPTDGSDLVLTAPSVTAGPVRVPGGVTVVEPTTLHAAGPGLLVTTGASTRVLPADPGKVYLVGRDAGADVVVNAAQASRTHLRIAWTGTAWTVTDTSSGGTFRVDGKPLPPRTTVPLPVETKFFLGRPGSGELVTLAPAGSSAATVPVWRKPWLWGSAATVAVLALVVGLLIRPPGATSSLNIDAVKLSVVELTMVSAEGKALGGGSGTIISEDGLILTNAHVAAPTAPGQSALYGFGEGNGTAVDNLIVAVTPRPDEPAVPAYRAKLLVADGYVDLAVIKITEKADGSPLDGPLGLPVLPIAPDRSMKVGDELVVLGFPSASSSTSVTVTRGHMSALVRDPHMNTDQALYESTATIRPGNSGGTAVDGQGRLVAVPTMAISTPGRASERARPIELARPLIEIAHKGGDLNYFSPYLVRVDENVKAVGKGVGVLNEQATCQSVLNTNAPEAGKGLLVAFKLETLIGIDQFVTVFSGQGEGLRLVESTRAPHQADDCISLELPELPEGRYTAAAFVGPNNEKLVDRFEFTVGATSPGSSPQPQGTPSTQAGLAQCTPGAPITSWPDNQAISLRSATRTGGQVVVDGGKVLIAAILGEQTGYATAAEASGVATAAVSIDPATRGSFTAPVRQRWMVLQWSGRYYAVQGQHRPEAIVGRGADERPTVVPMEPSTDRCYTPDGEYRVQEWQAIWYESNPFDLTNAGYRRFNSATGQITAFP